MGFCELPAKVKYQFSYSYFMLLMTVCLVSDDFQTFLNNQSNISDLLNLAVTSKSANFWGK